MDDYRLFQKDRQGRGVVVMLYVKENLEYIEVSYVGYRSPIECHQVKIREIVSKEDFRVGICFQPPNQHKAANKAMFGSLKQALDQQNLVLMDDFNYPDIYGRTTQQLIQQRTTSSYNCQVCQVGMRHYWPCYSQTKKTCCVTSLLVTALAAAITVLWSLGSC